MERGWGEEGVLQKLKTWEDEKTLADMEQYDWDLNPLKHNIVPILQRILIQEVDKVGWGWGRGEEGILQKRKTWEDEKTLADIEQYYWDLNLLKYNIVPTL